jgi:hypothetical protein
MRCAEAHRQMHELLSGTLAERGALDGHLSECAQCAAEYRALESVAGAAIALASGPADPSALDRIAEGLSPKLRAQTRPLTARPLARLAVAGLAAAALFSAGMATGRYTQAAPAAAPQVVEKPIYVDRAVEVPVVEERVVYKQVPVVRTRVVYRDRAVKALAEEPDRAQYAVANADATEPIAEPIATGTIVSLSYRAATLAPEPSDVAGAPPA